jgi:alpha-1,2-mannosyltransferase
VQVTALTSLADPEGSEKSRRHQAGSANVVQMQTAEVRQAPPLQAGPTSRVLSPAFLVPGVAVCVVSLAAFFLLAHVIGLSGYDLSVYLTGGNAFMHGLPVYDQEVRGPYGSSHFAYPPIALLAFGPLSTLSSGAAHAIMLVLGMSALWGVISITMRMVGFQRGVGLVGASLGIAGCTLWLQPVYDTLDQGQINIILMLLVLADFAMTSRAPKVAGVLTGIATAVKLTPAIFIVYLVLTRRFRAAGNAAVTFAVLTGLGFVVAPSDSKRYWIDGTLVDATYLVSPVPVDDVSNQSLNGITARFLGDNGTSAWLVLALVVGIGGLAVAVKADRVGAPTAGVLACAITGLLVSPVSWHEHWVWIVPVGVWLAVVALGLIRSNTLLAGMVPLPVVAFLAWPLEYAPGVVHPASILSPVRAMWSDGNHSLPVALLTTTYVSVGLFLLAATGWTVFRIRKTGSGENPGERLSAGAAGP